MSNQVDELMRGPMCEVCDGTVGNHASHCVIGAAERLRARGTAETLPPQGIGGVGTPLPTHHDAGSAEETPSQRVRFDKYHAMQHLLMEIGLSPPPADVRPFWDEMRQKSQAILRGMTRPRSIFTRIGERATDLEVMALAYRMIEGAGTAQVDGERATTMLFEAMKAWERAHPPAALDPLLLP